MFSASKFVKDMIPRERDQLQLYFCRPYLLEIYTELGNRSQSLEHYVAITLAELRREIIRCIRLKHKQIEDLNTQIENQEKYLRRISRTTFDFMEGYNDAKKQSQTH